MNLTLSPVIFISIKLSLLGKNNVTYKSIQRVVVGYDLTRLHFSLPPQFQYRKDKYDVQVKQRCTILFFASLFVVCE